MFRWPTVAGFALGLIAAGLVLSAIPRGRSDQPHSGPILSECNGRLRELVMQYEPSARDIVSTPYREFVGALRTDVIVHVVCPTPSAFEEFCSIVGHVRCVLSPRIVDHPITTWSRDRWVALQPGERSAPTTIWSPRGETADEIWPARAGDERVGQDLAAALAPAVVARRSSLYFDGGDFFADDENVFVVPRVLARNIQHTVTNATEFLGILAQELKRNVILLDQAPDHHAGMFMVSVGRKTMLVADPALGQKFTHPSHPVLRTLPGGADFSSETQRLFDAVAEQCRAPGYNVIRIPVVPAKDGRTFLTYVNVLMETVGDRRVVYLPQYEGVDPLNDAARKIWGELGYEIIPIDCTTTYRHFGSLHCLVNVLRRD